MGTQSNWLKEQQQSVCAKYNVKCVQFPANHRVGISRNIRTGEMPIYGVHNLPVGDMTGWYIWAGEKKDDPDFFVSLHSEHVVEWCPIAIKYLGLPPGWGFITDNKGYEDVWFDPDYLVE